MCFSEFFFIAADSDHAKTKLLSLLTVFGDFVTNPDPFREKDEKKYCFHRRQKFVKDACNSVCCNPLKQGSHYANRVLHARTVDLCSWSCGAGPQYARSMKPMITVTTEGAGGWTAAQLRTVFDVLRIFCWIVSLLGCSFAYKSVHYSAGSALVTLELTPKQI